MPVMNQFPELCLQMVPLQNSLTPSLLNFVKDYLRSFDVSVFSLPAFSAALKRKNKGHVTYIEFGML